MGSDSADELYRMLHELTKDYRSSISIGQKHFKVEAFKNHAQRMVPSPSNEYIDDLLESIEPIEFSPKRLKLELANKFKRPLIILDYIKKEEKLLVKRALQFSWMYETGNSPFTNPKTLVRVILPGMSYSTRLKIISGLSRNLKDEKLCQEIFKLVQEKYGPISALDLLPSCTNEFIKECLRCNGFIRINLTGQQYLKIAKKDHTVAVEFLTVMLDYLSSSPDRSENVTSQELKHRFHEDKLCDSFRKILNYVCPYLCVNHPHDFIKLYQKYPNLITLSRKPKVTKVLLTSCKETIISNSSEFETILNPMNVFHRLQWEEFVDFLKSLLPSQIEAFLVGIESILQWLDPLPYHKRWDALSQAFLKKYYKDILSFPEVISPVVLQLIPVEIRNKIAVQKLEADDPGHITFTSWENLPKHREGFWYSFMSLDKSIPKIKELLRTESDGTIRAELLTYLIKTCKLNGKDKKAMLEICKFVISKYRNDIHQVRDAFLQTLHQEFNLDKWMEGDVVDVLMEFVKLAEAYKDPEPRCVIQAVIRYHLLKDLPVDSLLNGFVKSITTSCCYGLGDWRWFQDSPDLEEKFLKLTIAEMAKIYPVEIPIPNIAIDATLSYALVTLLTCITNWKRRNGKISSRFLIQDYPWLITRIMEIVKTVEEKNENIYTKMFSAIRSDPEMVNLFLKNYTDIEIYPCACVLEFYLHKDITPIHTNLTKIIVPFILKLNQRSFKSYRQFFINLRGFPEMASSVIESCLEVAQDDGRDDDERLNALVILSYLWDSKNYLNTVTLFYPSNPKIDFTDEGFETKFQVKKTIVNSLTNTSNPSECLEAVGKFCIGDYTKATVGTLFSSCFHSNQQRSTKFLREELLDRPVSVKKLAIKLLCIISDREEVDELLTYLWENETHHTIRELIVSKLISFMNQNPLEKSWNLLQASVLSMTPDDKSGIQELLLPHHVAGQSKNTLLNYLKLCNQVVTKELDSTVLNKTDFRITLLQYLIQTVDRNMPMLADDVFITSFITEHLFEIRQNDQTSVAIVSLTVSYLFDNKTGETSSETVSNKIDAVSSKIIKLKSEWNQTQTVKITTTIDEFSFEKPVEMYAARKALHYFVTETCKEALQNAKECPIRKQVSQQIISKLLETVNLHFDTSEIFTERLYFKITLIFLKGKLLTVEESEPAEAQKFLFGAGLELQALTDQIINEYHPVVFSLYFDKLAAFFKDIFMMNLIQDPHVIFLLLGIISKIEARPTLSIENQIIACKLLPDSSPRTPELERKYNELVCMISKFSGNTTKAFLGEKNHPTY